ncbi:hypothetical protein [Natrialba swarupiae]|uniref:Uncharacterized protein n=1 Tax=Natrialba swarupiae TaxID=2448032 RepID=A0A5D5AKT3_9EURY|nr:hypothetical protein [Natrialba swarupiae]TYT62498.1 hypothetical protein FYC77_08380 [Natrialba swarupiae]
MQCGDGTVWLYRLGSGRQRRRLARDRQEAGRLGSRVAHDLDGTPDGSELIDTPFGRLRVRRRGQTRRNGRTASGHVALLAVIHRLVSDSKTVAMAPMAEAGRHTRTHHPCPRFAVIYAPIDPTNATASGQYDLETLAGLVSDLS